MKFEPLRLPGSFQIKPELVTDERGFFVRTFCSQTFAANGLNAGFKQCGASFNASKHTLRGMHHQTSPHAEAKLVRCTQGAAYHVILDLRSYSETYLKWVGLELNSENRHMLYVPEGVAHGFMTLVDATEIFYQISESYSPANAHGVRWDDPAFGIEWPATPGTLSDRDANFPDFKEQS